jgi:GH35 family endo-1,4-beta-xylanase
MTREEQNKVMSSQYWELWNPDVQAKIDRDIEANRKADALIPGFSAGTEVKVEQVSHEFIFGAHIFNFDQLGSDELNQKYKELYGTLFNSATIAFYWYPFEPEEGKPRFKGEYQDSAEFWNNCADPKHEAHWRRPATDPVVEFCESKGIRLHGHTLTWGSATWQVPRWLINKLPKEYLVQMLTDTRCGTNFMSRSPEEIAELIPEYAEELNAQMKRRIEEIVDYYGDRLQSWDIVNESATDFGKGYHIPGSKISKSTYGLMPGDYTYNSFKIAQKVFPESVKLNINDWNLRQCYPDQVNDLRGRGCKIDIMGAQMHLFNPQDCLDIAEGKSQLQSPEEVRETMERIFQANLPIHLSEITITAPNNDERGQAIQAVITRNLYRLWFSIKPMMGITWWNVVDDCGAPGEPSVSGLFSRNMESKPAFFALNDLINNEWKTKTCVKADKNGKISFRGFKGNYRLSWQDENGEKKQKSFILE